MEPCRFRFRLGVLLCLLVLSTTLARAQLRIGAQVLPQFTGLYNSSDSDYDSLYLRQPASFTFGLGLTLGYKFNDRWALDINLNYTITRQDYLYRDFDFTFVGLERELTLIKIPVMAVYSFKRSDLGQAWVSAGVQANLLVNSTELINGEDFNIFSRNLGAPLTSSEKYRGFTYSAVLGVGYDFRINDNLSLSTGIRADVAINDIENKDLQWDISQDGQGTVAYHDLIYGEDRGVTHHYGVAFLVGIRYQLGGRSTADTFRW